MRTKPSCKPAADFGIQDLWPNYNDGSHPSNCDPDSEFDRSKVHVIVIILCDCVNIPFFLSVYFVFAYIKFIFECINIGYC